MRTLSSDLQPIVPDAIKHGVATWQFDRLVVITTQDRRFLGVAVSIGRYAVASTVRDPEPPIGRRVAAVWSSSVPAPQPGEYLRSERGRAAFRIERVAWARRRGSQQRYGLDIITLPSAPADSVVHPWKWMRGSLLGRVIA